MGKTKERPDARTRILEAAGEAFADAGFKDVTVRDICRKAGVNVAAVNYHFGDKEALYRAVVRHWQAAAYEKYPFPGQAAPDGPEARLRAFIRSFLLRMLGEGKPSWFGKFVAREFIEPSPAHDILVEDTIHPTYTLLTAIVREMLGEGVDKAAVDLCSASIIGQCLYFHNARPVAARLSDSGRSGPEEIERIAEHISNFSITAIHALTKGVNRGALPHSPQGPPGP